MLQHVYKLLRGCAGLGERGSQWKGVAAPSLEVGDPSDPSHRRARRHDSVYCHTAPTFARRTLSQPRTNMGTDAYILWDDDDLYYVYMFTVVAFFLHWHMF